MTNEIGTLIGTVKHTFSNTNDQGDKCQLTINLDFSTTSDNDIRAWLCSNRVIAFARPLSKLTLDEMKAQDGLTFMASDIGKKVKSRAETVEMIYNGFLSTGMDEKLAREYADLAADSPQAMDKATNMVNDENVSDDDEN